jgi:hypothetical protein
MNAYVSCNVLCHYSCKTCNGSLFSNCVSCEEGYTLTPTNSSYITCLSSQIIDNGYYSATSANSAFSASTLPSGTVGKCGSNYPNLIFGYRQNQTNKWVSYTSASISNYSYYGFSLKMRILFIDAWPSNAAIKVHLGVNTSEPVWTWNYNNFGAYGE